jgi:hypothetical protein
LIFAAESDNKPAGDNTPVGENKDNLPAEQSTTSPSQQSTTEQSVVDQTTSSQPVADKDGKVVEIVKPAGGEAEGVRSFSFLFYHARY